MAAKDYLSLVKQSGEGFIKDDCPTQAAALSYYAIFALPPLLMIILLILGVLVDPQDIRGELQTQLGTLMGPSAGDQIRTILAQLHAPGSGGILMTVLSIAGLILGATGAFAQLQSSLNKAWEVKPDPNQGGLKAFLLKRVFSFGMILSAAFLLLVSLVVSAALGAFGGALGGFLPDGVSTALLQVLNLVLSFAVITALFAAIFKVLPDATVAWGDVWVGAAATALLFVLGKFLIGFYLGRSDPGQAFGAAGSLAVLLIWVYYSSMILLFGAEFTQAWAVRRGSGIVPEEGAVRVRKATQRPSEGDKAAA